MEMQGIPDIVPPNPWGSKARTCYFEIDGDPFAFFAYYFEDPSTVTSVALYKMDVANQRWHEVREIGDRALFWHGQGGGCCPAARYQLEPNCVYWINPRDSVMHVFDILARTKRVCYHPASKNLPKISSLSFWLLPTDSI